MPKIQLHNCDCLELLKQQPDNSVDLFLQDPPYNTTQCAFEYDLIPLLPELWKEWIRVGKDNAAFVFTGSQPFTTDLICSNRKMFKYELIWDKIVGTQFLDANRKPLKQHENILVFYTKQPIYNPQMTKGDRYNKGVRKYEEGMVYGKYGDNLGKDEIGQRFPKSIIQVSNADKTNSNHPTQKPIKLFEYLIKTYSNEGDTVFDGYLGSGTTAFAAHNTNRNFIGSELDKTYFDSMQQRFNLHASQSKLF